MEINHHFCGLWILVAFLRNADISAKSTLLSKKSRFDAHSLKILFNIHLKAINKQKQCISQRSEENRHNSNNNNTILCDMITHDNIKTARI